MKSINRSVCQIKVMFWKNNRHPANSAFHPYL